MTTGATCWRWDVSGRESDLRKGLEDMALEASGDGEVLIWIQFDMGF
jgi:hypothetical protein